VLEVERGAGAVVLAHGVDRLRIADGAPVGLERLRSEEVLGGAVVVGVRVGPEQALGQVVRLREEEPVPEAEAEGHVRAAEGLGGRDDVQHRQLEHALGVIERHAVGAAPAAIVPGHAEALEAELPHDREAVARHRPLGVGLVIGRRRRLRALPVAAQVDGDDGEVLREPRRHPVPRHVRLRVAVQEQERRAVAAVPHPNDGLAGSDGRELEAFEHAPGPNAR
jgi:hypothetical protein